MKLAEVLKLSAHEGGIDIRCEMNPAEHVGKRYVELEIQRKGISEEGKPTEVKYTARFCAACLGDFLYYATAIQREAAKPR